MAGWACAGGAPEGPRKLKFALIPKALDIPVFNYANQGAQRQAAEFGDVEVIYRGPDHGDELKQTGSARVVHFAEGGRHRHFGAESPSS